MGISLNDSSLAGPFRVFQPLPIGPVLLRNRIATTAHTTLFADLDGYPSQRLIEYQAARARGGVGLIISSGVRVRPASDIPHRLSASRDGCIARFAELADRISAEGGRFFVQLSETGRVHGTSRNPPVSSSPIPWRSFAPVPHRLDADEIADVVADFGRAAGRIAASGVDGIELQLGHGTLLQQFLSPASNQRQDRYGGSARARLQFVREVLHAVQAQLLPQMALSLRISADEFVEGGLRIDDMVEIVDALTAETPVDLLNVSHSAYTNESDSLTTQVADMSYPPAPFRHLAAHVRAALPGIPVLTACRVDTLELAEELLDQGVADVVGMARAHIADPDIVRKHRHGHSATIRHCIACNQGCLGNLERGLPITCTVNPRVGHEASTDSFEDLTTALRRSDAKATGQPPQVLVVGAGPAGMEAAIECRVAGLRVRVIDRKPRAGGQLGVAAAVRGRERWQGLVDDQVRLAASLGVDMHFGRDGTARVIAEEGPNVVIVATGSREAPLVRMHGLRHIGVEEAVASLPTLRAEPAVLIVDELGGWPAPALADDLAAAGVDVHFVTSSDQLSPLITSYSKFGLLERMRGSRVRVSLMRAVEPTPAGLALVDVVSGHRQVVSNVGVVVTAQPRIADDGLAGDLREAGYPGDIRVIGDAYAPRTATEAVADGHAVAKALAAALR